MCRLGIYDSFVVVHSNITIYICFPLYDSNCWAKAICLLISVRRQRVAALSRCYWRDHPTPAKQLWQPRSRSTRDSHLSSCVHRNRWWDIRNQQSVKSSRRFSMTLTNQFKAAFSSMILNVYLVRSFVYNCHIGGSQSLGAYCLSNKCFC